MKLRIRGISIRVRMDRMDRMDLAELLERGLPRSLAHGNPKWAFVSSGAVIAAFTFLFGVALYPNLVVSTLGAEYNLTVWKASSSRGTLLNLLKCYRVARRQPPCEDSTMSSSEKIDPALAAVRVCRISGSDQAVRTDALAVEEPLEIRVGLASGGRCEYRGVSITMRTPGDDPELAVGFLFTEGLIAGREQVAGVRTCEGGNVVRVDLSPGVAVDLARLERHFYTGSSCGVCGKVSLAAVRVEPRFRLAAGLPVVEPSIIHRLPDALRQAQVVFDRTGGLHASALFDPAGRLLNLREDVGRHNALDKLIGAEFLAGRVPLSESILLVSGRLSFELVQKAAVAGIPIVAAVGAPSSLAVDLAREHGLTMLGFVRSDRFNVYTGTERIRHGPTVVTPLDPGRRFPLSME